MSGRLRTSDSDDVNELVSSMARDLIYWVSLVNGDRTKCSLIYKVLQCIRASDPNAYEPVILSIGPYHNRTPALLPMEREKWLCLDYVLKLNSNRSLHDYLSVITLLEREVRICYSEDNIMNSKTFVEMLLLDSCFILVCLNGTGGVKVEGDTGERCSKHHDELKVVVVGQNEGLLDEKGTWKMAEENIPALVRNKTKQGFALKVEQDKADSHQQNEQGNTIDLYRSQNHENVNQVEQWYSSSAVYDLLLLENQVPFFVVTKIYELLVDGEIASQRLLTDNLSKFIEGVLRHFPLAIQDDNRPKDFDHLLHLCYMYFKPSRTPHHHHQMNKKVSCFQIPLLWAYRYFGRNIDLQENEENSLSHAYSEDMHSVKQFQRWRRAEQYHDAGVEFMDREFDELSPHSLLDIEFRDGILHIPCLPIDDKSATLFRNLIAFEQSCPALGNDIASYVYFLSQLISVPDDVALLSRKGVIVHQLDSDEEVSILFTKLFDYVLFDSSGEHYLRSLCKNIETHYQNRVNRWMAWLWHKHFGNPWLGFTAFASVLMVLCSLGQTVLAFFSYLNIS